MTPRERGQRAQQLLTDEVLTLAFDSVRERLVGQLEDTALNDGTTHHEVAITLQLLKRLRVTLRRFVDEGEAAQLLQQR